MFVNATMRSGCGLFLMAATVSARRSLRIVARVDLGFFRRVGDDVAEFDDDRRLRACGTDERQRGDGRGRDKEFSHVVFSLEISFSAAQCIKVEHRDAAYRPKVADKLT